MTSFALFRKRRYTIMKKFLKNLFFSLFLVLGVVLVVSCDKPTNEPTGGQPTDTHEHVITDDKWYRDSAVHWKECSGCDELIDMNEHTMGDYVQSYHDYQQLYMFYKTHYSNSLMYETSLVLH